MEFFKSLTVFFGAKDSLYCLLKQTILKKVQKLTFQISLTFFKIIMLPFLSFEEKSVCLLPMQKL